MLIRIAPGTEPVKNSCRDIAAVNVSELLREAFPKRVPKFEPGPEEDGGRFVFVIHLCNGQRAQIFMPGIPIEDIQGRWVRLYIDGNSWYWEYAVKILRSMED